MKLGLSKNREQGLTLVELFVVIAVIGVLAVFFMGRPERMDKGRALRVQCINNQKQVGLATRAWAGDHQDKYPASVSETNGGTLEFAPGPNEWRHFQVMSNELTTPQLLICPSDTRIAATNFTYLRNSNISFFIGVDANQTNSQLILAGDHNLTNGTPIKNGILQLSTNQPAGWTAEMHNKVGNVLLSDGSVQQVSITGLRSAVGNTGIFTNRLQMPILTP